MKTKVISGMGLFSCVSLIVGACVGSAIYSISGITLYQAGPAAIFSWLIAALIYGAYGIVVTKLALRYPRSGGIYVFPRRAIGGFKGRFVGFVSGWGYIISNTIALPFSAIYISIFLNSAFPVIPTGPITASIALLISFVLVFAKSSGSQKIQNSLVVLTVAVLLTFCMLALFGGGFKASNFQNFFSQGEKGPSGFISAVPLAMIAYGGCVSIAFLASEVRKPSRTIPLSLAIGLGLVSILYMMTIGAAAGTVPDGALSNPQTRMIPLFATTFPGGGLSSFQWIVKVISIGGALALLTSIVVLTRINIRALQAISTEGLLPRWSVAAMALAAAILCLLDKWVESLLSLGAVMNIVSITITCLALLFAEKNGKGKVRFVVLPVTLTLLLWLCYFPDILHSPDTLWAFTAAVYLVGIILFFTYGRRSARRISGVIVHGKGHGHLHNIPTANLQPYPGEELPVDGVWETVVFLDDERFRGVTNVGLRPSDDDSDVVTVETLLLDGFNEDLYGREITLQFIRRIRETRKFANLDELRLQIEKDIASCNSKSKVH